MCQSVVDLLSDLLSFLTKIVMIWQLIAGFLLGLMLIVIKHRRLLGVGVNRDWSVWLSINKKGGIFLGSLLDYGILITSVFISFYSSYLLTLNQTELDNQANAIRVLRSSESKLDVYEGFLREVKSPPKAFETNITKEISDSIIMNRYIDLKYKHPPYFILDHIPPDAILKHFSADLVHDISALEGNEKSALVVIKNEELDYAYRINTLDALLQFDVIRHSLFLQARNYLTGQINEREFEADRWVFMDSSNRIVKRLYHPIGTY